MLIVLTLLVAWIIQLRVGKLSCLNNEQFRVEKEGANSGITRILTMMHPSRPFPTLPPIPFLPFPPFISSLYFLPFQGLGQSLQWMRFDYDTTIPRRIRQRRKWSKIRNYYLRSIRLRYDYDEKLTCSFFARVEWKQARAIRRIVGS